MPDLIAQGPEPAQRWRRAVPDDQPFVLGRAAGVWAVPWDHQISRRHVRLLWKGQRLRVERLPEGLNPVFVQGKEADRFELAPGEHFVIGRTSFILADQRVDWSGMAPPPMAQQAFSAQFLKEVQFRNPDYRIEVLCRLPEVISGAPGESELFVRLVSMLLAGVPRADAAAVVVIAEAAADPQRAGAAVSGEPEIRVAHWDQRLMIAEHFRPSRGLILEALRRQQSVLHIWHGAQSANPEGFTESEHVDWAFATPAPGKRCRGWMLYLAGRFDPERGGSDRSSDPTDLREDVKFTELVATMLGSLRRMQLLEHQQAALSQFFAPVVLETLANEDPEVVLAPREADVSVMFCDLRGFSKESERRAKDLLELLQRVSNALGIMTRHIRAEGGVVGDFQGDAAMGFWGWPLPQSDAVARVCRAALAVRADFEATAGFRAGIGIASGRAVAGKIGTVDQVKVTVFGPVVNLASRLEGMTKLFRAPILVDETTAERVRRDVPRSTARLRRVARVRPYGLETPVVVSELLPPAADDALLTDEHLAYYEAALDAFIDGRWSKAFELLHRIPAEDQVKDYMTAYIAQHNRIPPPGWSGVIELGTK